ncbi:hypothetical protein CYMTET_12091 [Cymbomonas tetramitiformis]|uniref:Uncharacterized protein n=1 Tax=Cymbomonas tetramitiformis TaxID=36881 RepID=A0AAE0LCH5_9CHLO|nr:hypothetical protein CYMTET_12091 [Cymbomonas tetramitiformis]
MEDNTRLDPYELASAYLSLSERHEQGTTHETLTSEERPAVRIYRCQTASGCPSPFTTSEKDGIFAAVRAGVSRVTSISSHRINGDTHAYPSRTEAPAVPFLLVWIPTREALQAMLTLSSLTLTDVTPRGFANLGSRISYRIVPHAFGEYIRVHFVPDTPGATFWLTACDMGTFLLSVSVVARQVLGEMVAHQEQAVEQAVGEAVAQEAEGGDHLRGHGAEEGGLPRGGCAGGSEYRWDESSQPRRSSDGS